VKVCSVKEEAEDRCDPPPNDSGGTPSFSIRAGSVDKIIAIKIENPKSTVSIKAFTLKVLSNRRRRSACSNRARVGIFRQF